MYNVVVCRYGAKGILYFCYWSPAGQGGFARGGGIMYPQGTASAQYFNRTTNQPQGDMSLHSAKLYRRGAHYRHAKRLNSIVRNWGRYLLGATSTGIFHPRPRGTPNSTTGCDMGPGLVASRELTGAKVVSNATDLAVSADEWTPKLGDGLLVGEFALADGRRAVLLHNQNFDHTLWPTFAFHTSGGGATL